MESQSYVLIDQASGLDCVKLGHGCAEEGATITAWVITLACGADGTILEVFDVEISFHLWCDGPSLV